MAIAEAADEKELLAAGLFQRGYLRGVQGKFAAGLVDLRRARVAVRSARPLSQEAAGTLNAIAIVYNRMGDYEQSRAYPADAGCATSGRAAARAAVTWHNLGRANGSLGAWAEARQAFESSLGLAREIAYRRGETYALRGLASDTQREWRRARARAAWRGQALLDPASDARLHAQILLQRGIAMRLFKRPADGLPSRRGARRLFGAPTRCPRSSSPTARSRRPTDQATGAPPTRLSAN